MFKLEKQTSNKHIVEGLSARANRMAARKYSDTK